MGRNPNASKSHWRAPDGNEYPIVDAPAGSRILLVVTQADVKCASKIDPNSCALAQSWMRYADVSAVQIGIDKCYLPTMKNGKIVAMRWKTTAETKRAIDHFDRTGEFPAEGFWLIGISKAGKLESHRGMEKRRRERWGTLGDPNASKKTVIHLRNASRRAQVMRSA